MIALSKRNKGASRTFRKKHLPTRKTVGLKNGVKSLSSNNATSVACSTRVPSYPSSNARWSRREKRFSRHLVQTETNALNDFKSAAADRPETNWIAVSCSCAWEKSCSAISLLCPPDLRQKKNYVRLSMLSCRLRNSGLEIFSTLVATA